MVSVTSRILKPKSSSLSISNVKKLTSSCHAVEKIHEVKTVRNPIVIGGEALWTVNIVLGHIINQIAQMKALPFVFLKFIPKLQFQLLVKALIFLI